MEQIEIFDNSGSFSDLSDFDLYKFQCFYVLNSFELDWFKLFQLEILEIFSSPDGGGVLDFQCYIANNTWDYFGWLIKSVGKCDTEFIPCEWLTGRSN